MNTQALPRSHVAEFLTRIVGPDLGNLEPEAARAILKLKVAAKDQARLGDLLERNRESVLSPDEKDELDAFVRVVLMIDLLKAKGRRSLRRAGLDVIQPKDGNNS